LQSNILNTVWLCYLCNYIHMTGPFRTTCYRPCGVRPSVELCTPERDVQGNYNLRNRSQLKLKKIPLFRDVRTWSDAGPSIQYFHINKIMVRRSPNVLSSHSSTHLKSQIRVPKDLKPKFIHILELFQLLFHPFLTTFLTLFLA
jgi:hypothetical protein